jgi:hypothetical protein
MIELGITAAIVQNKATHQSIGALSDKSALVEGNIVALYDIKQQSFVRIYGNTVDCGGGVKAPNALPFEWGSERFLVVDAGNGRIALYSPCHRRFLATRNGQAEASVYPIGKLDDRPRCNESFRAQQLTHICNARLFEHYIQLNCDIIENPSSRVMHLLNGNNHFQVVQIHGFEPAK